MYQLKMSRGSMILIKTAGRMKKIKIKCQILVKKKKQITVFLLT